MERKDIDKNIKKEFNKYWKIRKREINKKGLNIVEYLKSQYDFYQKMVEQAEYLVKGKIEMGDDFIEHSLKDLERELESRKSFLKFVKEELDKQIKIENKNSTKKKNQPKEESDKTKKEKKREGQINWDQFWATVEETFTSKQEKIDFLEESIKTNKQEIESTKQKIKLKREYRDNFNEHLDELENHDPIDEHSNELESHDNIEEHLNELENHLVFVNTILKKIEKTLEKVSGINES